MCFKTVCNEVQLFAVKNRKNVLCRELCLVLCGSLDGKGVWGKMDKCICMAESVCCPPQTITALSTDYQFSSVQSLSRVQLFATAWTAARQASLSITNSWSSPKLMSIESVMPSSHLILYHPFLLLPPILPSIRVFSNESTLRTRWPKYWSFNFSISPSNEHPGPVSFRMDWLDLLAVQGTLKSLLQHHSSKASILRHSAFFTSIQDFNIKYKV